MTKTRKNNKRNQTLKKQGSNKPRQKCIDTFVKGKMQGYNKFKEKYYNKKIKLFTKKLGKKQISKEEKSMTKKTLKWIEKDRKSKLLINLQKKKLHGIIL